MRSLLLLPVAALGGCAASNSAPSLAPRPAEAIDPRVPVTGPTVAGTPTPTVAERLRTLVAQAEAGDAAFKPVADDAERLASAAGPAQSESWILAQQALSAAVAAREPVTRAMGDIDALSAGRIEQFGGIGTADLAAIEAASSRIAEIDSRQAAAIERIQARLGG